MRNSATQPLRLALCVSLPFEMRTMSRRRSSRALASLAAELGCEDGSDPKEFHEKPWNAPKASSRKALQLCEQVKDAMRMVLSACGDDVLRDLAVVGVKPAPNTGRLRVIVMIPDGTTRADAASHLEREAGMLRAEVASAICRKHAPELLFEVI